MAISTNISDNKKFKNETINIKSGLNESITFTGDIENQIAFNEKGNNIVITSFGKEEVHFIKVKCTKTSATVYIYNPDKGKYTKGETIKGTYNNGYNYFYKAWVNSKGVFTKTIDNIGSSTTEDLFKQKDSSFFADNGKTVLNTESYVDETLVLGTITLKNAGKEGFKEDATVSFKTDEISVISNLLTKTFTIQGETNKKNTLTGTFLNEELIGGNLNDVIKGVGGTNTIKGNAGEDKLYSGKGVDTFYFKEADAAYINGDVIYNADKNDTIELYTSNLTGYATTSDILYKSGNDLIIYLPQKTGSYARDKITLNNFYKTQEDIRGINVKVTNGENTINGSIDKDGTLIYQSIPIILPNPDPIYVKEIIQGKGNLKGTDENDTFMAIGKSTITTGNGNDTIFVSDKNDVINITGSGTKTINLNSYSGNQTINLKDSTAIVNIVIANNKKIEYYKLDNNLIIANQDTNDNTTETKITDYFKNDFNKSNIKIGNSTLNITDLYVVRNSKIVETPANNANQTIVGLKNKDIVNFYGGTGDKEVIISTTNNSYVFNNSKVSGNFIFDITLVKDYIDNYGYDEFRKNGNDLSYVYHIGKMKFSNTLKDYFTNTYAPIAEKIFVRTYDDDETHDDVAFTSYVSTDYGLGIDGVKNKQRKATDFLGTNYSDNVIGTKGIDYVETKDNDDYIYTNKGEDTIVINGSGTKIIKIDNGDGQDIIDIQNNSAILDFDFTEGTRFYYTTEDGNKVLNRVYDNGKKFITEKTIIKNYQDEKLKIEGTTFANADTPDEIIDKSKEKTGQTITIPSNKNKLVLGSAKDDNIIANGKDADIFAGAGKDKIEIESGSAWIDTGKGDDEIIVTGGTDIDFYIKAGDGNDTIDFQALPSGDVNYYIDFKGLFGTNYNTMVNSLKSGKMKFTKDGNDLIFSKLATKSKAENITIKEYFGTNHSSLKEGTVHSTDLEKYGYETSSIQDTINYEYDYLSYITGTDYVFGLNINGVKDNDTTTFTGVSGYDNVITFDGKGKANIIGSASENDHDTYLTKINSKTIVTLHDLAGENDVLFLNNSKGSLSLFFNIDKNGNLGNTDELYIFNKGSLSTKNMKSFYGAKTTTGYLSIDDYFQKNEVYTDFGNGSHIDVNLGKNRYDFKANYYNELDIDSAISQIGQAVTSWLGEHPNYSSTMDVLNNGTDKDIASMLKVYTGVKINFN